MLLNFANYFQIEAAAKGNVPFLLNLDLIMANEGIRRQEIKQQAEALSQTRSFENSVDTAYKQLSARAGQTEE